MVSPVPSKSKKGIQELIAVTKWQHFHTAPVTNAIDKSQVWTSGKRCWPGIHTWLEIQLSQSDQTTAVLFITSKKQVNNQVTYLVSRFSAASQDAAYK